MVVPSEIPTSLTAVEPAVPSSTASTAQLTMAVPAPTAVPEVRYDKPIPGSTLRCLDDPTFDPEINSPSSAIGAGNRTMASDVLEKARDRFDRFWGGNKEENV